MLFVLSCYAVFMCLSLFSFRCFFIFFFFNDTATTEIYTLSLHDALPIFERNREALAPERHEFPSRENLTVHLDRKSTRLNSSHSQISYAVFCLKKKKTTKKQKHTPDTTPNYT